MNYARIAKQLYDKGLEPIPIAPGQKYPTAKGWPKMPLPVEPWPKDHGIGLRTGSTVIGLDLDIFDADLLNELIFWTFAGVKGLTRTGQPPKILIPVYCPEVTSKLMSEKFVDPNGVINQIEVLSRGQQFVSHGIHPGTGKEYTWSGDLVEHSLPNLTLEDIKLIFDCFHDLAIAKSWTSLAKVEERGAGGFSAYSGAGDQSDAPGSIYNRSVSIEQVLQHYGWKHYRGPYWTRPGKERGVSGALYGNIFWCFTDKTTLRGGTRKEDRCFYDAFELLIQYEFAGDKVACARALRRAMQEAA